MRDLQTIANSRIADLLDIRGFVPVEDVISDIENLEDDMNGEDYAPYYSQHEDVIREYESDFGSDSEEITHGQTFAACDYIKARASYAYALVWCAYSSFFAQAKESAIDALREFESDVQRELSADDVQIQVTSSCNHGWSAHDRELEDGTMIFESGQLDGCNGMERRIASGFWVSCCMSPKEEE